MTTSRLTVRHAPDGTAVVGEPPPSPAGSTIVALVGATAVYDPTARLSRVVVHDLERGTATVGALFGDDVAEAVATGTNTDIEPIDTDERQQVERLGWLEWLSDNYPIPLDPDLLALEAAVARAELPLRTPADEADGSDGGEDGPPDVGAVRTITAVAGALREDQTLPLRGQLISLIRLALAHLPVGNDSTHPEVAHERALWHLMDAWGAPGLDVGELSWLDSSLAPTAATHLGPSAARGLASLDWRRVPRQLLPAPEASIAYELTELPDGAGRLRVSVAGPPRPRLHPAFPHRRDPMPSIIASLTAERWPLPLTTGTLTYDPEGHLWHGLLPVKPLALSLARQAPGLDVDVRASHLPFTPPDPAARRRSLARRWAARAVASARLADAAGDARRRAAAGDAFAYAARLWAEAGDQAAAARCRVLADGRVPASELTLTERWLLESGVPR